MSIKVGVYDFFAHLIGGGFLLANILYISQKLLALPISIANLSSTEFLLLGVIAYVLGYAATPMSSHLWYRFFAPKDLYQRTIKQLAKDMPTVKFNFDEMDWYTLVAFIKKNSVEMAQDVEQYNAISIMLRNTSFSFLLFGLTFGIESFVTNYSFYLILISSLCLIISIVLIRASVTHHTYFFRSIHQTVIALLMKPEQLPMKLHSNGESSQVKKYENKSG